MPRTVGGVSVPWQAVPPAQTGRVIFYAKSDNKMYYKGADDIEIAVINIEPYIMFVTGALTVTTGKSRVSMRAAYTVESIVADINTAPTGASVILDVNKNGTTLFTTQANRPTIAAAAFTSSATQPDVLTFGVGDYLTVDVDQIGSIVAGSDMTVNIRLRRI